MDTAGVPNFIRTLAIIILCYYLFKFAMRLLAPYLMQKVAKKAEEHIKRQFEQQQQNYQSTAENNQEVPKKDKKVVGDYIDYEEVE
jgi:ABC-type bacteriocin/lantibiotic exporter with double-glycine peptidase domain